MSTGFTVFCLVQVLSILSAVYCFGVVNFGYTFIAYDTCTASLCFTVYFLQLCLFYSQLAIRYLSVPCNDVDAERSVSQYTAAELL